MHRMIYFSWNDNYAYGFDSFAGGGRFVSGIPLDADRDWQQQWTSLGAGSGGATTSVAGYTIIL